MKKVMVVLVAFLLVFVTGCDMNNNTGSFDMDLNAILEVDSGQPNVEVELNHKNLISDKPQHFLEECAQEKIILTFDTIECNLLYKDSLYYPVGSKTVHRYIVEGNENKTILVDEKGNVNSILYGYTKLSISQTASPKDVFESLKKELAKILDISYYKNVKMSDSNQKTEGFGIYDYVFYNNRNGYITDYLKVSVSDDGSVFGLSINNLAVTEYKSDIDKEKENTAIELKLKDIYNTNATQYQSYSMAFDPCIIQYNDQIYVRYFLTAKYLHTKTGEMITCLNDILIPLNNLCN